MCPPGLRVLRGAMFTDALDYFVAVCCRVDPFGSTIEVEAVRRDQFAEFAKAVQVGLLDYQGPQGIQALFSLMKSRYGEVRCSR